MTSSSRAVFVVAILLGSTAVAWADPITIVQDRRVASATVDAAKVSPAPSDAMEARVNTATSLATATLFSSYANLLHWSGNGQTVLAWEAPANLATNAAFDTDFHVASPVTYTFNGTFAASPGACCSLAESFALLSAITGHTANGDPILSNLFTFADAPASRGSGLAVDFTNSGRLEPGDYSFDVNATAQAFRPFRTDDANALFSFKMDFAPAGPAPTPEPASLLLIGSGLAGVFLKRARSARERV